MEINFMKFHLSHILKSHEKNQPESGPLLLYQKQYRALIGEVLVQQAQGPPGPYTPLFYQAGFSDVTMKLPQVRLTSFDIVHQSYSPALSFRMTSCSSLCVTCISSL